MSVDDLAEEKTWRYATLILIAISLLLAGLRALQVRFFTQEFEIALFYVPTILSLLIYLRVRSRPKQSPLVA